jgi:cytochrome c553
VRQLYEFQTGARNGAAAALMKPVVANLTVDDMVALAAYLSSQAP